MDDEFIKALVNCPFLGFLFSRWTLGVNANGNDSNSKFTRGTMIFGNLQKKWRYPFWKKCSVLLLLVGLTTGESSFAQAFNIGDITTVAGGGATNVAATAASIIPFGVAVDNAGNIFIADTYNNRIRKVAASTGIITTVAGNGSTGYSGDNGPATDASFRSPMGVAVDRAGNIYIADKGNNCIRKVDAGTGAIATVAGNGSEGYSGDNGPATAATMGNAQGVAVDNAGNIFIADMFNAAIRKVDAGTGIITTVAGNGSNGYFGDNGAATAASLCFPYDVAVDGAGNLFIADMYNNRIRKVDARTGIITTIAGNGSTGNSGDSGAATAASLNAPSGVAVDNVGNVYITDHGNNRIRQVAAGTGIITTVAGNGSNGYFGDNGAATAASLNSPNGVAADSAGNVYIADSNNYRIRQVDTETNIITTVAGNGSAAYSGDNGPATAADLASPHNVAIDSAGNLLIADTYNNRIRRVAASTGIITTVAGNGSAGYSGDNGPATGASLNAPFGLTLDSAGNIFIADTSNYCIRKVAAGTGIITTVAGNGSAGYSGDNGPATGASFFDTYSVAVDNGGNLFIADYFNGCIRKVAAGTGIVTTVARNIMPSGVAVDSAGNLFIAEGNFIRKMTAGTGIITTLAGNGNNDYSGDNGPATAASLSSSESVVVDSAGNIFIADTYNSRIRKIDAGTGVITTVAGNGSNGYSGDDGAATAASLFFPTGVALDGNGNLYIADRANSRIRIIYLTSVPLTISGTPAASITAGSSYSFTPSSTGATSFSISNKPSWASFNTATGELSGTPANANAGTYSTIVISAYKGSQSASLLTFSITVTVPTYSLSVVFTGSGTGGIDALPAPPGTHCNNSCSQSYPSDTSVTFTPVAESGSFFSNWSGCDQVTNRICTVVVNTTRTISANFEFNWPILIGISSAGYNGTLQGAYDSLAIGNNLLQLKSRDFTGDVNCNKDVQLTLHGGCNEDATDCSGMSNLNGNLKISAGSVSLGNVLFK